MIMLAARVVGFGVIIIKLHIVSLRGGNAEEEAAATAAATRGARTQ